MQRLAKLAVIGALCPPPLHPAPTFGEQITTDNTFYQVLPDQTFSVLFFLRDSETPLFGYSLDVGVTPLNDATGSINADPFTTNFFDPRNLITAGGSVRDPKFSRIIGTDAGGVFITTNVDPDSQLVNAVPTINDVLAQVFFDVSFDALGDFEITLGPASALSIGAGQTVDFSYSPPGMIQVIPEPTTLAMLFLGSAIIVLRKRYSGYRGPPGPN